MHVSSIVATLEKIYMTIINCVHIIFNEGHKYRNVSTTNVLFRIGQWTHIDRIGQMKQSSQHFASFVSGKINLPKTQRNPTSLDKRRDEIAEKKFI